PTHQDQPATDPPIAGGGPGTAQHAGGATTEPPIDGPGVPRRRAPWGLSRDPPAMTPPERWQGWLRFGQLDRRPVQQEREHELTGGGSPAAWRAHASPSWRGCKPAACSAASRLHPPSNSMMAARSWRSKSSAGSVDIAGPTGRSTTYPGPSMTSPGPQRWAASSSQVELSGASMPDRRSLHQRRRLTPP